MLEAEVTQVDKLLAMGLIEPKQAEACELYRHMITVAGETYGTTRRRLIERRENCRRQTIDVMKARARDRIRKTDARMSALLPDEWPLVRETIVSDAPCRIPDRFRNCVTTLAIVLDTV